ARLGGDDHRRVRARLPHVLRRAVHFHRSAQRHHMRKDLRFKAMLFTLAGIAVVGMFILLLPGSGPRAASRPEIGERFSQGVVMLHAKQYEHALTAFHRVLELDPTLPEAYVNSGFALLGMGEAGAARDFFASALELRPRQLNAYYGLAVAY